MKRTRQLLGAVSGVALIALSVSPAYATGTTANTTITNTVTVDYKVGTFDQTQVQASDSFKVDRKINVLVEESGFIGRTNVSPNQTQAVIQFKVSNLSNDALDLGLTATAASGSGFTLTNIKIYSDANGDGIINGTDAQITYLDEVEAQTSAANGFRNVIVIADIPAGATQGQLADVVLTATAYQAGTASSLGTIYSAANTLNSTQANTTGVDTVFADGDAGTLGGVADGAKNGKFSAIDGYVVKAAALSVLKQSKIVSDPVNGTTNPKAIPGAVVEYCIVVANGNLATFENALSVIAKDTLPADMEIVTGSVRVNGTVAAGSTFDANNKILTATCNTPNSGSLTHTGVTTGTVGTDNAYPTQDYAEGLIGTLASAAIRTLYFNATIR
ncbi:MAG: hypothetical protein WAT93_03655 [Pontixanthobacter sp.]